MIEVAVVPSFLVIVIVKTDMLDSDSRIFTTEIALIVVAATSSEVVLVLSAIFGAVLKAEDS